MGYMSRSRSWLAMTGLALALLLGIMLRTFWSDDIEYKGDERYTFETSQAVLHGAPLPMTGMHTSMGPPNTPSGWQVP